MDRVNVSIVCGERGQKSNSEEVLNEISNETDLLQALIWSFPRRCKAVIAAQGGAIKY